MAHRIVANRKNVSVVIHATASNSSFLVAGNSSQSNIVSAGESAITGAYITQAAWGCDGTGYIVLKRGANVAAVYDSTGQHDYAGCGIPLLLDQAANVGIEFVGSANGFIIFEMQKVGAQSEYVQT